MQELLEGAEVEDLVADRLRAVDGVLGVLTGVRRWRDKAYLLGDFGGFSAFRRLCLRGILVSAYCSWISERAGKDEQQSG